MSVDAVTDPSPAPVRGADLLALTKPRITFMVVLTTAVGFVFASRPENGGIDWGRLLHTVIGTALVASGASALNMVVEAPLDARMRRTATRPIPAGRLDPFVALAFAVAVSVAGMAYLATQVDLLTAAVGALTLAGYVFVYTPMKRKSSLSTIVGALPGAAPPVMGCTAAAGVLGREALALFALLFLWQLPHFLAIAWLYKSDYQRGGFAMLTVDDDWGDRTSRQMVLWAAALVPASLLPNVFGLSGPLYLAGALVLGLVYLAASFAFVFRQDARAARRLLLVSVLYLPVVLALLVVDRALL